MVSLPKPEVIFTHESDLDGLVAGLLLKRLARYLFDTDVPLEAHHNQSWRQRSINEKSGWVTDMSFQSRLDKPDWVIIDHHPIPHQPTQAQLVHDLQKSASLLCYELCQQHELGNEKLERLVHLSNVADLFQQDDPDFVTAYDYASLVKTYHFWSLYHLIEGQLERLLDHPLLEVMEVKRRVENPLGYNWSRSNITEVTPTVGFVDTIIGNVNLIIHQLLQEKVTPYPVLVTLFRKGNGTVIASFRSRNGQALEVAQKFNGGGHPNACGASLPRSVSDVSAAIHYLRQTLNPTPYGDSRLNSLEEAFAALENKPG